MRQLLRKIFVALVSHGHRRECNVCGWHGLVFLPFGTREKRRWDAVCPKCGGVERHRFVRYITSDRFANRPSILHVAPESCIEGWLRSGAGEYLSIDLYAPNVMRKMDLTRLELQDRTFDFVWCSHVLEHVSDDAAAMAEMFRVLKPGGTAIIQVPIKGDTTYEDPTITEPDARAQAFLQSDHVRLYGIDIVDRLAASGFRVETIDIQSVPMAMRRMHAMDFSLTNQVFLAHRD